MLSLDLYSLTLEEESRRHFCTFGQGKHCSLSGTKPIPRPCEFTRAHTHAHTLLSIPTLQCPRISEMHFVMLTLGLRRGKKEMSRCRESLGACRDAEGKGHGLEKMREKKQEKGIPE